MIHRVPVSHVAWAHGQCLGISNRVRAVDPASLLPMVNRHDPTAAPPSVFPADLEHGVANLQNRGFIPPAADVTPAFTHDPAPVTAGQSPLYPHEDQFVKAEIYSSPFGFNAVNLKLDLVTRAHPVKAASHNTHDGANRSDVISAAYGWSQMQEIEQNDTNMDLATSGDIDAIMKHDSQEIEDARAALESAELSGDAAAIEAAVERFARAEAAGGKQTPVA